MREIAALPFDDLVRFVEHPLETEVAGDSGRTYRSKVYAFWDMDPYDSDLFTRVKVTGRGLQSLQRFYGVEVRGPETEFRGGEMEDVEVSATWTEIVAWTILALVVTSIVAISLLGIGYLMSRAL